MVRNPKNILASGDFRRLLVVSVVLTVCSLTTVVTPILVFGFPDGGYDQPQHLRFAISYYDSFTSGMALPVWGNDTSEFGSVGVRFYPPLAPISAALGYAVTGHWQAAFTLALSVWMFLGALGLYLYCRQWVDYKYALLGSFLFTILPYHLLQIYQYFLFAEFVALNILPFCFLFLTRLLRRGELRDSLFFGVSCSLLTLAHIPTAMLAALIIPFYALALFDFDKWKLLAYRLGISAVTCLVLSVFYWQRIFTEFGWLAHTDPRYSSGVYSFSGWLFPNFVIPRRSLEFWMTAVSLDITVLLTVLTLVPGIVLAVVLIRKVSDERKVALGLSICGLVSLFMLSKPSEWLWANFPLLERVQFPFRWLTILSFLASASFAVSVPVLARKGKRFLRPTIYFGIIAFLLIGLFNSTQIIPQIMPIDEAKFEKRLESLPSGKDNYPWWPVWAKPSAFENLEKVSANRITDITEWNPTEKIFAVHEGEGETVRLATFFYPFWNATVNGMAIPVERNADGTIAILLPPDSASVRVFFEEPTYYSLFNWISLLSWLIVVFFSSGFSYVPFGQSVLQKVQSVPSGVRYAE